MLQAVSSLLLVLAGLILIHSPSLDALLVDCDIAQLTFYRAYTNPDGPIIQTFPPGDPPNLLGYPAGYSPFSSGTSYVASAGTTDVSFYNPISVTNANNPIGIVNGRLYINMTLGVQSTPPYYPNVTITLNGTPVLAPDGGTLFITASTAGNIFIEIFGIISNQTNTLVVSSTSAVVSTGISTCGKLYGFSINNPTNVTAAIIGDPLFRGLRGQSFQVHGIDGGIYNIISDKHVQVNSRFVFLNGPRDCPIMPSTAKKSPSCWTHPGSYLGELGIESSGGDYLFIKSGPASTGFVSITYNDEDVDLNTPPVFCYVNTSDTSDIIMISTHEIQVSVGAFTLLIENIDSFLNLRSVSVRDGKLAELQSHGLLGQTWQKKRYRSTLKVIEGEVDDYLLMSDDIFGNDFVYNKFDHLIE